VPKGDLTIEATVRLFTRRSRHISPRSARSAVNEVLHVVAMDGRLARAMLIFEGTWARCRR